METKKLISSYDEMNDVFVGKISDKHGYCVNYEFSNDIFINMDENNLPSSIHINNASDILNVNKSLLEKDNISIFIECSGDEIYLKLMIADKRIFNKKTQNVFNIPQFSYEIKTN